MSVTTAGGSVDDRTLPASDGDQDGTNMQGSGVAAGTPPPLKKSAKVLAPGDQLPTSTNGPDAGADLPMDYLKLFSVIEMKFFRKFGLSEQEELLACWDCRLDLYVPRNGKLFLSRHPSQGGHICFSSCKLNKSNVKVFIFIFILYSKIMQ